MLKYAPIKTEFARGIATDETIKTDLSKDMTEMPTEPIEAEIVEEDTADADADGLKES